MTAREIFALGLLLFSANLATGETTNTKNIEEEIELPYRILETTGKAQAILIGSAHNRVRGVSSIATPTRELLASTSLIAFEALPAAPSSHPEFPTVRSYLDAKTYTYLEEMTRQDKESKLIWRVVTSMPLPPEIAAPMFFLRCYRESDLELKKKTDSQGKSLDQLVADSAPQGMKPIALESSAELNSFRDERTMQASARMLKGAVKASLSSETCTRIKGFDHTGDELIRSRNVARLYDHHRIVECTLYACSGWLNGVAFSKTRNKSLAGKILRHAQAHRRIAVIVGALHLDDRAGLIQELKDSGFREISTNIVADDRP